MKKAIIVLGGVTSGVGKGLIAASIAHLLIENKFKTTMIKFDGLLNTDFEQMNPYQKKLDVVWSDEEVTVLNDGGVVDSDIGVYERFTGTNMTTENNIVNGACWKEFLDLQNTNHWKTGTVLSVFPHLSDIYKNKIRNIIEGNEFCVIEVGGTVGDYESEYFMRSLSHMTDELELFVVQVSYVPYMKTENDDTDSVINQNVVLKPVKQSYFVASALGLRPNVLILRQSSKKNYSIKKRVSMATGLAEEKIFFDYDVDNIYKIPSMLYEQRFMETISEHYGLSIDFSGTSYLTDYVREMAKISKQEDKKIIAIVGFTESWDSYTTIQEAIISAGVSCKVNVQYEWFKQKDDYVDLSNKLSKYDAFIFTEGAENVAEKKGLLSRIMEERQPVLCISYGASILAELLGLHVRYLDRMILGAKKTEMKSITGGETILERHRRRFSIPLDNSEHKANILGWDSNREEIHIFESKETPNCKGVVFHPEYNSKPYLPSKFLTELIGKCMMQHTM